MNDFFKIDGFDIKHIKETNELVGISNKKNKIKKCSSLPKILINVFIFIPLIVFTILFIENKHLQIKNHFIKFETAKEKILSLTEYEPVVKIETTSISQPVETTSTKTKESISSSNTIEKQELPQSIILQKDYTSCKPWEALNTMKKESHSDGEKQLIDSMFNYLCTFEKVESKQNQSLATIWQIKRGSVKNLSELFSYVINSSRSGIKCYTVKSEDNRFWNEIEIEDKKVIYDIAHKKITTDNNLYTNGFRY